MSRFAIVPASIYEDQRLTAPLRDMLVLISTYADRNGWCWPSQEKLAKQIGCNRENVSRIVTKLVKFGYLTVKRRPGSSLMRLVYDLPASEPRVITSQGAPDMPPSAGGSVTFDPPEPDITSAENRTEMCAEPHKDVRETAHRTLPENNTKEGRSIGASRIPDGWALTPELREWAAAKHPYVHVELEAEKFLAYWQASASPGAVKFDWHRGFQSWILNGAGRYGGGNRGPIRGSAPVQTTEERRRMLAAIVSSRQARADA